MNTWMILVTLYFTVSLLHIILTHYSNTNILCIIHAITQNQTLISNTLFKVSLLYMLHYYNNNKLHAINPNPYPNHAVSSC